MAPLSRRGTRTVALAAMLALAACVEGPLERTNILDTGAGGRITLSGIPDTLFSRNESFEVVASFSKDLPGPITGASFRVAEGQEYLFAQGGNRLGASFRVGLLPVRARLVAYVYDIRYSPVAEKVIWLRQRPTTLDLDCEAPSACGTALVVASVRSLVFRMTDSTNVPVDLPPSPYRFGTVISRAPGVVEVVSRPTPSSIVVRGVSPGSAWVVMSGESVRDSVLVSVLANSVQGNP